MSKFQISALGTTFDIEYWTESKLPVKSFDMVIITGTPHQVIHPDAPLLSVDFIVKQVTEQTGKMPDTIYLNIR